MLLRDDRTIVLDHAGKGVAMLTKKTVFVLGAGASSVYGFPLGRTLCQSVIRELEVGQARKDILDYTKFSEKEIDHFREELRESGQSSVDAFLEHRRELIDIGKAAMTAILVKYEQASELWSFEGYNWMRHLFEKMNAPFETFGQNLVSFITYNYDRSLEHFLCRSLRRSYRKTDEECATVLQSIPIIHLHGRLGYLPWQLKERNREYEPRLDARVFNLCTESIKIVHEEIDETRDNDFHIAHQLLNDAEKMYYLGFGYGEVNVKRLDLASISQKETRGTGIGLTNSECQNIVKNSDQKLQPMKDHDCIGLLRNYVQWD
jgi:hypothetical protein